MATEIQQVKISQLNSIGDWRNAYTVATDRNGQSVKAPIEQVSKIGDLSTLTTAAKTDLVSAINEAATTGNVTVDSSLSPTSENPVQNKVINTALGGKQDTISDLATIRSGAAAGATAVQPGDMDAVKYTAQTLTSSQQEQSRTNIGAMAAANGVFLGDVIETI